ncbi:hypothetical protein ABDJ41_20480 [Pedobacter sp. ASV1-7]|uniref:hypothetical protein n=1 Tax=Pedobacter sp. ASV1-7 TaxID=3145237 RepID=UPI0032E8FA14
MLKETILKVLGKQYAADSMIEIRSGRYDLAFKTDDRGRPILLFMGQKDANGKIKGERYARRLLTDTEGRVVKDHWDHKGKATAQL